jgi:hypothetical protein
MKNCNKIKGECLNDFKSVKDASITDIFLKRKSKRINEKKVKESKG